MFHLFSRKTPIASGFLTMRGMTSNRKIRQALDEKSKHFSFIFAKITFCFWVFDKTGHHLKSQNLSSFAQKIKTFFIFFREKTPFVSGFLNKRDITLNRRTRRVLHKDQIIFTYFREKHLLYLGFQPSGTSP